MSHHAIQVAVSVYLAAICLAYIASVGRPRKPIGPADAVVQLIVIALLLWAVWSL